MPCCICCHRLEKHRAGALEHVLLPAGERDQLPDDQDERDGQQLGPGSSPRLARQPAGLAAALAGPQLQVVEAAQCLIRRHAVPSPRAAGRSAGPPPPTPPGSRSGGGRPCGSVYSSMTRPGRLLSRMTRSPEPGRLPDVVGHEQHRQRPLGADPLQLVVQQVAGHRVEGTERLVHQQHVGVLGQRAGQRDPLPHAAGQLVRPLVGEAAEPHGVEQLGGPAPAGRPAALPGPAGPARRCGPPSATGTARVPGTSARPCGRRCPPGPRSAGPGPATRFSSVLLPQPDAPMMQTNSPSSTVSETWSSASSSAAAGAVRLADVGQPDRVWPESPGRRWRHGRADAPG